MVTFFFRKKQGHFHSIEELFASIPSNFSVTDFKNVYMPYHRGIGRLWNLFYAFLKKSEINHITGDVFYLALALPRKKLVLTVHDIGSLLNTSKGIKRRILRYFWFEIPFKKARKIIAISNFTKHEIIKEFNLSKEKITVIPDCVSEDFVFSPKNFNTKKPEILAVGTKKNKNLCGLFAAVEGLNVKILILGKLSDRQISVLKKYKIDYENFFDLPRQNVVELYRRSDIVYFASFYEGFGMPVLEAQATGRPLITSDLPPMNQICGKGALLVNPYDITQIKNAIKKIILEPDLRKKLIEEGLKNVKNYSAQFVANAYEAVYSEINN